MKKKNLKICVMFLVSIFFALFLSFNSNFYSVSATIANPDITKSNCKEYNFDETLFNAILKLAKTVNYDSNVTIKGFDEDFFEEVYSYEILTEDNQKIIERNEIVSDLKLGKLNLVTGQNAKYDCLKNVSPIKNITGLNSMNLSFVKELILDDNNIVSVANTDLNSLTNLQTLSIQNNLLTNFSINPLLTKLENLDLSSNLISQINLTSLVNNAKVDISQNKFQDFGNIIFSSSKTLNSLDLNFNKLINLSQENIQTLRTKATNFIVGVQGINSNETVYAGDQIKIYNLSDETLNKLSVIVEYFEGNDDITASEFYSLENSNVICQTQNNGEQTLYLPAGKIKISFKNNGSDIDTALYSNFNSKVVLSTLKDLSYSLIVNGKAETNTYQESDVNVKFYIKENENIPNLQDILNNVKFYSNIGNDNNYSQKDNLLVNSNGTFNCSCYVVFDGIKSNVVSVEITRKNIKGIVLGIVVIVVIFVVVSAGYYISKWYRNGAEVAPLSEKEIARLNYKRSKQKREVRENFVKGFGRDRHFESMKVDDEVLSDLNSETKVDSYYNSTEQSDYDKSNINEAYNLESNFDKYDTEEFKNDFDDNSEENNSNENLSDDGEEDE